MARNVSIVLRKNLHLISHRESVWLVLDLIPLIMLRNVALLAPKAQFSTQTPNPALSPRPTCWPVWQELVGLPPPPMWQMFWRKEHKLLRGIKLQEVIINVLLNNLTMMEFHVYHVPINSIFMNFDACRDLIKIGITLQTSTYIYRKTTTNKQTLKLPTYWDLNQMIMQMCQIVIRHILIMMGLLVLIVLCLLCSLIRQVGDVLFVMLIRSIMRVKELVRIDRFCIFLIEMIIF